MQNFKQSFTFLDINQFSELNQSVVIDNNNNNSALNFQSFFPFSNESFLSNQQAAKIPGNCKESPPGFFHDSSNQEGSITALSVSQSPIVTARNEIIHESNKKKPLDVPESSYGNSSSPLVFESWIKRRNNSRRGKKAKINNNEENKPKDVVHVRARRGEATDSHSLAERVRRGKINDRLKCLQDIVPGCYNYKSMGMAVMLDKTISYVQSLQNQVEFLSMKLTAASSYYDFNSDSDAMEIMQGEKAQEPKNQLERLTREEDVERLPCFHSSSSSSSTWSSLKLDNIPQHNRTHNLHRALHFTQSPTVPPGRDL